MEKINKIIAVTAGDPAGIGAEIVSRTIKELTGDINSKLIVIGRKCDFDPWGEDEFEWLNDKNQALERLEEEKIVGLNLEQYDELNITLGQPTANSGKIAYRSIEQAVELCSSKEADAIVTAPISKDALKMAGYRFTGHTTIFTELLKAEPVMTFYTPVKSDSSVLVSLVSMHIPLTKVHESLTIKKIEYVIKTLNEALVRYFGIEKPRIAVSGLNPHAGEGGMFGNEEAEIICPAIMSLKDQGLDVEGAIPPDTVFYRAFHKNEFDGIVSMYHDQGLIAVKTFDFLNSVQMTLGLPFLRTSVDHGTAYDIAGKGIADINSMVNALKLADKLS